MKIVTLTDNVVYGAKLNAEHGFSLYMEDDDKKILFDTGQSENFIKNAFVLGIDISKIDAVVISHGHYDHTGGLRDFIRLNKKAKIYLKKECFEEKYGANEKYIGIPFNKNIFNERLTFINEITEIADNFFLIPQIKIFHENDTHFKNMFIKVNNDFIKDEFSDEQFFTIKRNDSLIIISGCSHRGITNIVKTALDIFNLPVDTVLGGFHLKNEDDNTIINIVNILNDLNIKRIGVSHCTGINAYEIIKKSFDHDIFYNYTGLINEI